MAIGQGPHGPEPALVRTAVDATIGAARAEAAGHGRAVVDQVRQLAGSTAAGIAAVELRLREIREATDDGIRSLGAIESLVGRISQG